MDNIILFTDSYKASHFEQYPPGTTSMFSYAESRGGRYDKTLFFGLQYFLKEYLSKPITSTMVKEAKAFFTAHGEPFPEEGWNYIVNELGGKLPVRIRAVAEGTVVPTGNVLLTCESTDPKVFWVASWIETAILRAIWYPTTVATQSWHIKQTIKKYLEKTSTTPETQLAFKLHDFGARGVSSHESAMIGGAAHLVNFMGSDTVEGVWMANQYYNNGMGMCAFSIPAMEHSSVTSWGRSGEVEAYRNMLNKFAKPGAILACVSDSYNLYDAVEHLWGTELKQQVVNSGATVVIRPDSGDPVSVVFKTIKLLGDKFGYTTNSLGYKILNNVRVIQGDGINEETIEAILNNLEINKWSTENIAFGMGGALLQQIDRDTQKFAYKCSSITVNGQERDVFKSPATDPGKKSKAGRLDLIRLNNGSYETCTILNGELEVSDLSNKKSVLRTVFENGELKNELTLEQVRAHSNGSLL